MSDSSCPNCSHDVPRGGWGDIGEIFVCHNCGHRLELEYDESWDGEGESYWFWFTDKGK